MQNSAFFYEKFFFDLFIVQGHSFLKIFEFFKIFES